MSEMVERVARAVRMNRFVRTRRSAAFDETVPPTDLELDDARAAIAEMIEPTQGMMDVFYTLPCWGDGPEARDTWRVMVDEALRDE